MRGDLDGRLFQDESLPKQRQGVLVEPVEPDLETLASGHHALRIAFDERQGAVLKILLEKRRLSVASASMKSQVPGDDAAPADEALLIGRAVVVREEDDSGVLDDVVDVVAGRREATRGATNFSLVRGEQSSPIVGIHSLPTSIGVVPRSAAQQALAGAVTDRPLGR